MHSQSQEADFRSLSQNILLFFYWNQSSYYSLNRNTTPLIYNLCHIILIDIFMAYSHEICLPQGQASHVDVQIFRLTVCTQLRSQPIRFSVIWSPKQYLVEKPKY